MWEILKTIIQAVVALQTGQALQVPQAPQVGQIIQVHLAQVLIIIGTGMIQALVQVPVQITNQNL